MSGTYVSFFQRLDPPSQHTPFIGNATQGLLYDIRIDLPFHKPPRNERCALEDIVKPSERIQRREMRVPLVHRVN